MTKASAQIKFSKILPQAAPEPSEELFSKVPKDPQDCFFLSASKTLQKPPPSIQAPFLKESARRCA